MAVADRVQSRVLDEDRQMRDMEKRGGKQGNLPGVPDAFEKENEMLLLLEDRAEQLLEYAKKHAGSAAGVQREISRRVTKVALTAMEQIEKCREAMVKKS